MELAVAKELRQEVEAVPIDRNLGIRHSHCIRHSRYRSMHLVEARTLIEVELAGFGGGIGAQLAEQAVKGIAVIGGITGSGQRQVVREFNRRFVRVKQVRRGTEEIVSVIGTQPG